MALANAIKQHALDAGFDLVAIASPSASRDLEFLPQWVKKGYGGELHYLADPRREDPRRVLPSVKSIICVGLIYNSPYPYSTQVARKAETALRPEAAKPSRPGGQDARPARSAHHDSPAPSPPSPAPDLPAHPRAWISRYAWGSDYHQVMRKKLEQLRAMLERGATGVETRVYVDTGPIVERAFARLSGIGWMGKNTCLINEGKGSWFFLGVILTNLELEPDLPAPDRCGTCTRCLEACPTGALVEPYVMDASRCISYLNIELKGSIPEEFRPAMANNVFGCDICQDVCPWNGGALSAVRDPSDLNGARGELSSAGVEQNRAAATSLPEFQPMCVKVEAHHSSPASGPLPESRVTSHESRTGFSLFHPSLQDLASLTEEDFRRVFARSPIKRTKYRGWLRNLCVAAGNSGDGRFIPWLEELARNSDSVVQEHALWALRQLSAR